jgi:hypothetical protein
MKGIFAISYIRSDMTVSAATLNATGAIAGFIVEGESVIMTTELD